MRKGDDSGEFVINGALKSEHSEIEKEFNDYFNGLGDKVFNYHEEEIDEKLFPFCQDIANKFIKQNKVQNITIVPSLS